MGEPEGGGAVFDAFGGDAGAPHDAQKRPREEDEVTNEGGSRRRTGRPRKDKSVPEAEEREGIRRRPTGGAGVGDPEAGALAALVGFEKREDKWLKLLEELWEFKREYGHCNVPAIYRTNQALATWVSSQRFQNKRSTMPKHRYDALEAIGFVWDAQEAAWQEKFSELKRFMQDNQHCNVSKSFALGKWISKQRIMRKKMTLTEAREEALNSIGFDWGVRGSSSPLIVLHSVSIPPDIV